MASLRFYLPYFGAVFPPCFEEERQRKFGSGNKNIWIEIQRRRRVLDVDSVSNVAIFGLSVFYGVHLYSYRSPVKKSKVRDVATDPSARSAEKEI